MTSRRWELRVHYIHSQPEELLSLPQNKIWKNFFPPCDLWIEWNRDLNSSLKVSRLPLPSSESKVITHYRFLFPPLEAWLHCKLHRDGLHVFMELCAVTHWSPVQYEPEARAKHNKLLNYYLKYFDILGYFFLFQVINYFIFGNLNHFAGEALTLIISQCSFSALSVETKENVSLAWSWWWLGALPWALKLKYFACFVVV